MAVIAGKASPAARQWRPPVSCCRQALVPELALWWLCHLLGWLSWRCKVSGSSTEVQRFPKCLSLLGLCIEDPSRLSVWEAPGLPRTLVPHGGTPHAACGRCTVLAPTVPIPLESVAVASPTLLVYSQPHARCPSQILRDRAGVRGKKEIQGSLVLSLTL